MQYIHRKYILKTFLAPLQKSVQKKVGQNLYFFLSLFFPFFFFFLALVTSTPSLPLKCSLDILATNKKFLAFAF